MQIAFITDTHFGVKNDAPEFIEHQLEFYRDIFFPTLIEHGVTNIIHTGDIFDRRKYTNHATLARFRTGFFDLLVEHGMTMFLLVGNHDTAFKNTNDVNSPELLLGDYIDNVDIITSPRTLDFDGECEFLMVPWINQENHEEILGIMNDSDANVLCGHFEIKGFEMHRGGGVSQSGLNAEMFKNFNHVFSGHFHEPSNNGQIYYLGAPYEYTWSDFDCERGFYLFDTVELELTYFRNPLKMHHRIMYDDAFDPTKFDVQSLAGKIVRLIVGDKVDSDQYDEFIKSVESVNPFQFEVIDNTAYHIIGGNVDDEALENEDTLSIVEQYVDGSSTPLDKERLNGLFKSLYIEALAVE